MDDKNKLFIKGGHAGYLFLILLLVTPFLFYISTIFGDVAWNDIYGVAAILFAISFLCSVLICGIYILGNGMRYMAALMLEMRNDIKEMKEQNKSTREK